jgi:hypothetical protein
VYYNRTNSTKIQKPVNLFPVSQNNILSPCLQPAFSRVQASAMWAIPHAVKLSVSFSVTALNVVGSLLATRFQASFCSFPLSFCTRCVQATKSVLTRRWEFLCLEGEVRGCASIGDVIPFNFVYNFSLCYLKFPYRYASHTSKHANYCAMKLGLLVQTNFRS